MAHSVIEIPVATLEPYVRRRREIDEPRDVSNHDVTYAHITLLGPFVSELPMDRSVMQKLQRIFAAAEPFEFDLVDIRSFDNGPTYLAPEPDTNLRQLTNELAQLFPEYPPYRGAFDKVIPHLALGSVTVEEAQRDLESLLPLHVRVDTAELVWWEPSATRTLARFALSGKET